MTRSTAASTPRRARPWRAYALLVAAALLTACEKSHSPADVPQWQRPPGLVDAATQTYRFMDGQCRSLQRIPAPWRLQPDTFVPAWRSGDIELEADTAAFGIPPPAKNRATGEDQYRVSISLGTRGYVPNPTWERIDSQWRVLLGLMPLGEPIPPRWPLADAFKAYAHPSGSGDYLYYDATRRMIVLDRETEGWPNGFTDGVIWLSEHQALGFRIPYEALDRLDVLAEQFQSLPAALSVPCTPDSPPAARPPTGDSP